MLVFIRRCLVTGFFRSLTLQPITEYGVCYIISYRYYRQIVCFVNREFPLTKHVENLVRFCINTLTENIVCNKFRVQVSSVVAHRNIKVEDG